MANSLLLKSTLEKNPLNDTNFIDWYRNLRIVLKHEKKLYEIESPIPPEQTKDATIDDIEIWQKLKKDADDSQCTMLASMMPKLQKQHEHMDLYSIILYLKEMLQEQARFERYETSKELFQSKMAKGSPIAPHVIHTMGLIENLEQLGFIMDNDLYIDLIFQSLLESYNQFVMKFHMNGMEKTLTELLGIFKIAKQSIKKEKGIVFLMDSKKKKMRSKKSKSKTNVGPKDSKAKVGEKRKDKKGVCFHCGAKGYWLRNWKAYLESKKKHKGDASCNNSSIHKLKNI